MPITVEAPWDVAYRAGHAEGLAGKPMPNLRGLSPAQQDGWETGWREGSAKRRMLLRPAKRRIS